MATAFAVMAVMATSVFAEGTPGAGAAMATTTSPPMVPLSAATTTPTGSWAVAAMGDLGDPLNTFWQLFFLPDGGTRWSLVTPPGVASNGGLAVTITGDALTAGFEPSHNLYFSPLALTTDSGSNWSQGLVPFGIAAVPDALAGRVGSGLVVLVRRDGGQVLAGNGTGSRWRVLGNQAALRASAGSCRLTALSAVTLTSTGTPMVGATCTSGRHAAVLALVDGRWRQVGPSLHGVSADARTAVLRLALAGSQVSALVAAVTLHRENLVAMWQGSSVGGGGWTQSSPLRVSPRAIVRSTAIGASGQLTVLLGTSGGHSELVQTSGSAEPWNRLPSPPPGTSTVASTPDGAIDGFVVHRSVLTVYRLPAGASVWQRAQYVTVPIPYGSSG